MNKIIWSDKYLLGYPEIDQQHKSLVNIINSLIKNVERDPYSNGESFHFILNNLFEYAREHFESEERVFNNPDHAELHMKYLEAMANTSVDACAGVANKQRLLDFLFDWWYAHITVEDMKFKKDGNIS